MKLNIFSPFYLVVLISGILFLMLSIVKYYEVKSSVYEQKKSDMLLLNTRSHSTFLHYESILELLGQQLMDNNAYKNDKKAKNFFKKTLRLNSELLAFGLLDIDGKYLSVSANIDIQSMPNIKFQKQNRLSFIETLNSDYMVIGRTYYIENLKTFVMPLRKAIRDENGNVIGVMTTGVKVNKEGYFLNSNIRLRQGESFTISKDYDSDQNIYNIYSTNVDHLNTEYYNTPVSKTVIKTIMSSIEKENNVNINDIRKLDQYSRAYILETVDRFNEMRQGSLSYDKRYKIFLVVTNNISLIKHKFFAEISIYFVLYAFSQLIFFFFFKFIARMESKQQNTLQHQSIHDNLTKLPNIQYLRENYNTYIREYTKFEVIHIDLDRFKNINDNYGRDIGDDILREASNRLKQLVTKEEMLIHQGGDEFIIVRKVDLDNDKTFYIKIIELLGNRYFINRAEFKLGASLGIANYPKDSKSIIELLSLSDMAMNEAKKQRNTYVLYSQTLKELQYRKVKIDQELQTALENNEIYMLYQVQVNNDGSLYGVEALARWNSKELGRVAPDEFIPVSEETNQIVTIGRFICSQSATQIYEIQKEVGREFRLSINLSVRQLLSGNFIEHILEDVQVFKGKFHLITLEITERLFIKDLDEVIVILNTLRSKGFEISLDDFGTGYSSLSILKSLPIDELKIDKSFIDEILYDANACTLSKSIIQMGQELSMKIVAEGVETIEQVELLKQQKCDILQGYYYSKPLSEDDLISLIRKENFNS